MCLIFHEAQYLAPYRLYLILFLFFKLHHYWVNFQQMKTRSSSLWRHKGDNEDHRLLMRAWLWGLCLHLLFVLSQNWVFVFRKAALEMLTIRFEGLRADWSSAGDRDGESHHWSHGTFKPERQLAMNPNEPVQWKNTSLTDNIRQFKKLAQSLNLFSNVFGLESKLAKKNHWAS